MNGSSLKLILTSGFAMFSMFFGSGNLVFPILIGIDAQQSFMYSILGFILTGVCLPFLGLVGIMQFQGDRKAYFKKLTPIPAFILTLIMLSLMGPLGIIPRCASVSYGGFAAMFPTCPLWVFNACFCIVIASLIWQKNRIVEIIGIYLTPIKLGSFILLIIIGLLLANQILTEGAAPMSCLQEGIRQGYQTMDLVASFFFGGAIYEYLKTHLQNNSSDSQNIQKTLLNLGIKASIFGGLLLSLCYVGFVMLGAKYAFILKDVPKESFLMVIAHYTIGSISVPFVGITLIVSCLATATITASLFTDFIQDDVFRNRLARNQCIVITLVMAYALSLLGFSGICIFLSAILEWVYPFLMVYAAYQMVMYFYKQKTI